MLGFVEEEIQKGREAMEQGYQGLQRLERDPELELERLFKEDLSLIETE